MKTNRWLAFFSLACLLLCTLCVIPATSAQTAAPAQVDTQTLSPETQNFVLQLLSTVAVKFPWLATVIAFIGSMRLWAKPVFSALHALVDLTPSKWDDGVWNVFGRFFTENPLGKFLAYLLDWLGSVKLTPPAKQPQKVEGV